jgi:hypothetical protein
MRASLVHFKEQQAGHLLRRLERDQRPRGTERKLLKHHLHSKRMKWFQLPPFEITEDLVLRYNSDFVEGFRMGPEREKTFFIAETEKKRSGDGDLNTDIRILNCPLLAVQSCYGAQ